METNWAEPVLIYEGEDEAALKRRFVELSVRYPHANPYEIGFKTFEGLYEQVARGAAAGLAWSKDLDICEAIRELGLVGVDMSADLPTKEMVMRELYALARLPIEAKDRIKAYETLANIAGYIEKPGVTVNNNTQVVNVLRVPTRDITIEDDRDFAQKFKEQQLQLVSDARSNRPN